MTERSSLAEVRNPLLGLPAAIRIRQLPLECRAPLADLLREVARDADAKAEAAWRKRKGPMAAYWRATSTYAKHTARAIVTPSERRALRDAFVPLDTRPGGDGWPGHLDPISGQDTHRMRQDPLTGLYHDV